jgi:hypothetical protein
MSDDKDVIADSTIGTNAHREAVLQLGSILISLLFQALKEHDQSKMESPEVEILDLMAAAPDNYSNGSWGDGMATGRLDEASMKLRKFLRHHYKHNNHHPEHHENGIDGMDLIDLVEMFCDWSASTLRTKDGNIYRSIQYNEKRFKMSPQLTRIFMNTALRFDEVLKVMSKNYTEE